MALTLIWRCVHTLYKVKALSLNGDPYRTSALVGTYPHASGTDPRTPATVKQHLTFEQGQRGELHLGALVAELGRAVGPPLPGSAHGPAREAVHLLRGRHREAGGRRGRAGRRQLGRLHDSCRWRCVRACVPLRV